MKKEKRNYQNSYPSVTQALGVLRKVGLEQWFLSNTRAYCEAESKKAKQAGTDIHTAIQQYIEKGIAKVESMHAEEVSNALNSFILFRRENPKILLSLSEVPLTSEFYGYNGTIDAPHPPMLCDWKGGTAKDKDKPPIHDEYLAQASAYVYLWNETHINERINEVYIVALAKDKVAYNIHYMDVFQIEQCFNDVFLPALKIYNWQKRNKRKEPLNDSVPNGHVQRANPKN